MDFNMNEGGGVVDTLPPGGYQQVVDDSLDANKQLAAEIQRREVEAQAETSTMDDPKPKQGSGTLGSLWQRIKDANAKTKEQNNDVGKAMLRGTVNAANALSNTVVGAGAAIAKKTGLYKLAGDPQGFLDWWEKPTKDANPFQIGEERENRWLGAAKGGLPGFVEGATQFAVGQAATKALGIPGNLASGAVADAAFFDPQKARLSNLIQDGPEWLRNPVTQFLQAKDDDSEGLARFKQAAEGFMLGGTIESLTHGFRALKASLKGDTQAVASSLKEASEVAAKPAPGEVAKVAPTEDGKFAVASIDDIEKTPDTPIFETHAEAEQAAASINFAHGNSIREPGVVGEETLKAWQERMKEYGSVTDERSMQELRDKYALNINYIQKPEELMNVVKSLVDVMPEPQEVARGRVTPWTETAQAARSLGLKGMTDEQVVEHAAKLWGDTRDIPKRLYATREVLHDLGSQVYKLSQMADANPDNAVAVDQLSKGLDTMLQFHSYFAGAKSDVARALNVLKAPVGQEMDQMIEQAGHRAPSSGGAFDGMSRSEIASMMRMVHLSGGDPAEIIAQMRVPKTVSALAAKTTDPSTLQRIGQYATTLRIEAMLSGPKTHITNIVSNAMAMMQQPVEYYWAGLRSGNSSLKQFGADLFGGLWKDHSEALSAAKKSFLDGTNILDPGNTHTGQAGLGAASGLSFLRPSRFLMASDEFFKQMNYRSNVRAQILQQARADGITDAAQLAERVASDLPFAFTPDGGAVIPKAMDYTRYATFTNELNYGWGQALQKRAQESVWFRNVMPFVRTPTNIFRYAWERTPVLNRLNRDMQEAFSGARGEEAKQIAKSRSELGGVMYGTAAMLAMSGQITGRGPSDPDLRKQWIAAGHQPYSIKIPGTDQWMSYRRLDPTMAPLGLVADLVQMSGEVSAESHDNAAAAIAASITSNLASKTYMQGLVEFMDAMASGQPHKFQTFVQSAVGSFVPNVLRQTDPNDTYRETYGILDDLASRVPWLSEGLEPRRNILGEKIMRPPGYFNRTLNPFTVAPGVKPSSTQDQLLQIGKAFSMPSTTLNNGLIDLTDRSTFNDRKGQSPYDRMLELMSTGIDGGPSLREQLESVMKTDEWKNAPGEDAYGPGGLKFQMASDIIHSMQEAAQGKLLEEYPTLRKAYVGAATAQGAGLVSGKAGVDSVMKQYDGLFKRK